MAEDDLPVSVGIASRRERRTEEEIMKTRSVFKAILSWVFRERDEAIRHGMVKNT